MKDKGLLPDPPESELYLKGYRYIAGIDEAGRGPLAGPVVASAVILDPDHLPDGIADSKTLTPEKRECLYEQIQSKAIAVAVGIVESEEIDRLNILRASLKAMELAVIQLQPSPDFLLVDGPFKIPSAHPQKAIKFGDSLSPLIAAASIIAKVTRDRLMLEYHEHYPAYNFAQNKGYGTKEHLQALKKHGCCPLHRKSFKHVKEILPTQETLKEWLCPQKKKR
jgi:ribonuclease HII